MKKENPSKVVIIPRPPVAANEDTNPQDSVIATQSIKPPMTPEPAGEANQPSVPKPEAAKRKVCNKAKLPKKPVPHK